MYKSAFNPSPEKNNLLRTGKIIGPDETASEMIERVVDALEICDKKYSNDRDGKIYSNELGVRMEDGRIVMSTPILTNAGRYTDRPLSACTMPSNNINDIDMAAIREEIDTLHQQGMGTGFNLSKVEDPVSLLRALNEIALEGSKREIENRPVGNMAILSVYHPKILEFIKSKTLDNALDWKFNISVDVDDNFFEKAQKKELIELQDGSCADASSIFYEICDAAKKCADPGLIFLDRLNKRNPVPILGDYETTAPCGEVGLTAGESCQFGYINVAKFVSLDSSGEVNVNYDDLEKTVKILARSLDNALTISLDNYVYDTSRYIMTHKRKIGIGLCGVADALSILGIEYASEGARKIMVDILSFINYSSKVASVELANERGPALAMNLKNGNRYFQENDYISELYCSNEVSGSVPKSDWKRLALLIKQSGLLRNTTTIALPPTGRSALIYSASTGVEPHFSLDSTSQDVKKSIACHIGRIIGLKIYENQISDYSNDSRVKSYLSCANNIDPKDHIAMLSSLQSYTDESISKTINMPQGSTIEDVGSIYMQAYKSGVSGVTVYVDGSLNNQPINLGGKS